MGASSSSEAYVGETSKSSPKTESRTGEIQTFDGGADGEERTVFLMERILTIAAHHWVVKIGRDVEVSFYNDVFYELNYVCEHRGEKKVYLNRINGDTSGKGVTNITNIRHLGVVGTTRKSNAEIEKYNLEYLEKNPAYDTLINNCQCYAISLIKWITDGHFSLPVKPDSSFHAYATSCQNVVENYANADRAKGHVASAEATFSMLSASTSALSYDAQVGVANPKGQPAVVGTFVEASLAKAEVAVRNGFKVGVDINADTGIGVANGTFKFKILGFGFVIGREGIGIGTPLAKVSVFGRQ